MIRGMVILSCRDCYSPYYVLPRYAPNDSGLCAKCDNEIAELEEKYGEPQAAVMPSLQPSPESRKELRDSDWAAFLGIMGGLAFSAFAWWGLVSAARYVWRML
jgi:hypothetical protein